MQKYGENGKTSKTRPVTGLAGPACSYGPDLYLVYVDTKKEYHLKFLLISKP